MDHTAYDSPGPDRTFAWLVGLSAVFALLGIALFFGLGRGEQAAVDQLPASPVQVLADTEASALGADGAAARPVLEVAVVANDADPPAVAASEPGASPSTGAPPAQATDGSASSTTLAPAGSGSSPSSVVPSTSMAPGSSTIAGTPPTTTPAEVTSTTTAATGLNAVELELARLTNELRANPNGPLSREGAVIDCDGRVPIDPSTGQYEPIGTLTIDQTASVQVSRNWSSQLTTNLQHRPQAGIPALQGAGIDVAAAGENIAYHNFPDTAMRHFVGWRESDGHFCNMMDPTFTHLGVGEITDSDGFSFATQNFFSLRSAG